MNKEGGKEGEGRGRKEKGRGTRQAPSVQTPRRVSRLLVTPILTPLRNCLHWPRFPKARHSVRRDPVTHARSLARTVPPARPWSRRGSRSQRLGHTTLPSRLAGV